MRKIIVINHVTLDCVMQGPGHPDEDRRGNFSHGGWATARSNEAIGAKMGERMGREHTFLFGHRSYAGILEAWNRLGGPFKDALNNTPKYVASRSAATKLDWPNSTLLHGDIPAAVAELREQPGGNLVIMGSGELIGALLAADLIDEWVLMIHPLILGTGRRLFRDGGALTALQLVENTTTDTGVILATYGRGS